MTQWRVETADPDQLRQTAASLAQRVHLIRQIIDRYIEAAALVQWEGAAADAFGERVRLDRHRADRLAEELLQMAQLTRDAARSIEAQPQVRKSRTPQ